MSVKAERFGRHPFEYRSELSFLGDIFANIGRNGAFWTISVQISVREERFGRYLFGCRSEWSVLEEIFARHRLKITRFTKNWRLYLPFE
jgi:hypothetical protein